MEKVSVLKMNIRISYKLALLLLLQLFITGEIFAQKIKWDKSALWISPGYNEDTLLRPCPVFKRDFNLKGKVLSATLAITARGIYEAELNGKKVGKALFTPGWTAYPKRMQYQVYDVLPLLKNGDNEFKAIVGEGWYRGAFGGLMARNNYGSDAGLLAQLTIIYTDGTTTLICSDQNWNSATGYIRHSDIYGGEMQDGREISSKWYSVKTATVDTSVLAETISPAVTAKERFSPVSRSVLREGTEVIDFGQNLAGYVSILASGKAGDTITIAHAEVLKNSGDLFTDNLREAKATDVYVLDGKGYAEFHPHFSWHGFRFIRITKSSQDIRIKNVTAVALYSDLAAAGDFKCSDKRINRLQENIKWSMKGNFLDVPTDCPQRSERLGWTGDAEVFFPTAAFNMNVDMFFRKWLTDLSAEQREDGSVPNIIPNIYYKIPPKRRGTAGWGDAAVIVPWEHFEVYGDTVILKKQYHSMKAWVTYIEKSSVNGLWLADGYGDWLAPGDSTSVAMINQCFWAHSTDILAKTAAIIGKRDEAEHYSEAFKKIKEDLLKHYFDQKGTAQTHTQTAYILSLAFGLLPDTFRSVATEKLSKLIIDNDYRLATGFLGTPFLLKVLSDNGRDDLAYKLLLQTKCPSWLYPISKGATTMWEKWDAVMPNDSLQRTSFNHYGYGAVGDWLYHYLCGIKSIEPGYRKVFIRPVIKAGISWARASYPAPQGRIISTWRKKRGRYIIVGELPVGISGTIELPDGSIRTLANGRFRYVGELPK